MELNCERAGELGAGEGLRARLGRGEWARFGLLSAGGPGPLTAPPGELPFGASS